jgi:hypothetical protein
MERLWRQAIVSRRRRAGGGIQRSTSRRGLGYLSPMADYAFTDYFENEVLRKRPYLEREWCIRVLEAPIRVERQENNRWRFWAAIPEFGGRYLRVVTLEDRTTIHNAFPDRGFTP